MGHLHNMNVSFPVKSLVYFHYMYSIITRIEYSVDPNQLAKPLMTCLLISFQVVVPTLNLSVLKSQPSPEGYQENKHVTLSPPLAPSGAWSAPRDKIPPQSPGDTISLKDIMEQEKPDKILRYGTKEQITAVTDDKFCDIFLNFCGK